MYKRFTELLRSRHTTVAELCRSTGLRESSLSNWKKRDKGINTDTLITICKFFNVSSDWFLGISVDADKKVPDTEIILSSEEQDIINAYRKADSGTKDCICKLLDVKRGSILSVEVG